MAHVEHAGKRKRKPQYSYVRVQRDGSLRCADQFSADAIRKLKPAVGELVRVTFSKPRNYQQFKKAHQLGTLIVENIDEFADFVRDNGKPDSHAALKKLQQFSGVECDDSDLEIPGIGKMVIRQPRSLAFDEMDEAVFQAAYAGFCQYLIKRWWPGLDQDQIEQMASLVGMAA